METIKRMFYVDRREIAYLRMTFESYDGMAVVKTLDPRKALIEVSIAPGCQDQVEQLVEDLVRREGIKLDAFVESPVHPFHKLKTGFDTSGRTDR